MTTIGEGAYRPGPRWRPSDGASDAGTSPDAAPVPTASSVPEDRQPPQGPKAGQGKGMTFRAGEDTTNANAEVGSLRSDLLKLGFDADAVEEVKRNLGPHARRTLQELRNGSDALEPLYTPSQRIDIAISTGTAGLHMLRDYSELIPNVRYSAAQVVTLAQLQGIVGIWRLVQEARMTLQVEPVSIRAKLVEVGFDADALEEAERELGPYSLPVLKELRDGNDDLAPHYTPQQRLDVAISAGAGGLKALRKHIDLITRFGHSPDHVVEVAKNKGVDGVNRLRRQAGPS